MALFVANDTLVKFASRDFPPSQILVVRGVFACLCALVLVLMMGELRRVRMLSNPRTLLRSLLEALTAITFISAIAVVPLADLTALTLISPLLMTAASALLLGEDVRWRRWLAVGLGFVGMLLIVQPGTSGLSTGMLLGIACAILIACRDLVTRLVPPHIPSVVVMFGTTIATTLSGVFITPLVPWRAFTTEATLALALASIFLALGNLAIVLAFRNVEVSVVTPYRYTVMLWAVLSGLLIFGEWPTPLGTFGIVLIVGSGLYTFFREQVRRRGPGPSPP
jgi:drug/metabolite transporter (DMT)-like permease